MTPPTAGTVAPPERAGPTRRRAVIAAAVVVVTGVALVAAFTTTAATTFEVVDQEGGEVIYSREVPVGSTITLEHVHSVTKRPVIETFSVADEDTIAMELLVFDAFGPNLPAGPEHVPDHATFERDGTEFRVDHHGFPIGTVPLMVGSESVDHQLRFEDGGQLHLFDHVRSGSRVELRVGN